MLSSARLPFLPSGSAALRRYREQLVRQCTSEPALQILPALLSLPLGLELLPDAAALLAHPGPLALCGNPSSGRTLALLQTLLRWAEGHNKTPVLYLSLREHDLADLAPHSFIAAVAEQAGLPRRITHGSHPGLLLLDDWELLPARYATAWQQVIIHGVEDWPGLKIVAALPAETRWPGVRSLTMPSPDVDRAAHWLAHLLPDQNLAPLNAALALPPLLALHEHLSDLLLLALSYPIGGLPGSRADLYEYAYTLVRPLLDQLRLSLPSEPPPELWAGPRIGRALLQHYRLARQLIANDGAASFSSLSPETLVAVAPLAVSLLDDPAPLLERLWSAPVNLPALRALVACAREEPEAAPLLGLRLLDHLSDPTALPDVRVLLFTLGPVLARILAAAAHVAEARACVSLRAVAAVLPGASRLWLQLGDDPHLPAALRWAAADLLIANPPDVSLITAFPVDAAPQALIPRAYVAACAIPAAYPALATSPLYNALALLLADRQASVRRTDVANVLLAEPTTPEELQALALTGTNDPAVFERVAAVAAPGLRQAALNSLRAVGGVTAHAALCRLIVRPASELGARRAALDTLARLNCPGTDAVLTRTALDGSLPLPVRLRAVELLAGHGSVGILVLRRLLGIAALPALLRAAAAIQLGQLGVSEALPLLGQLLQHPDEPLLRRAAATALGTLAQQPAQRDAIATTLSTGMRRALLDTELGERIARALGQTGSAVALPVLATLLAPTLAGQLEQAWLQVAPALAAAPATAWPDLVRGPHLRLAVLEALADGATLADPPSRLRELAARQATRLAIAAAEGLAILAAEPARHASAATLLRHALRHETRADVARVCLNALACCTNPAVELQHILDVPSIDPSRHWLAVERLSITNAARTLVLERLAAGADQPVVLAQMIKVLATWDHPEVVPTLRRLASDSQAELLLRREALLALGRQPHPDARTALIAVAAELTAPFELRLVAASALPSRLSIDDRVALRQALRSSLSRPEVTRAIARVLAHVGDNEALPHLLRSAQSDSSAEAIASLEALGALGDPGLVPDLLRISQSTAVSAGVHLAAIIALLHLDRENYLPLLREFLSTPFPALRLKAYTTLAELCPDDPILSTPLVDLHAPLALRLQALKHLAGQNPDASELIGILIAVDEQPQLRLAAAQALSNASHPSAALSLAAMLDPSAVENEHLPPLLRYRCAKSLGLLVRSLAPSGEAALTQLTRLISDPSQPVEHHLWVATALLER